MHRFISTPRRQLILAPLATVLVMLAFSPAAFASASSAQAYNPGGNKVLDVPPDVPPTEVPPTEVPPTNVPEGTENAAAAPSKGALSFTGLSLGLVAGAGVLLFGLGVGTRRVLSTRFS
jgi:hypothetical protein